MRNQVTILLVVMSFLESLICVTSSGVEASLLNHPAIKEFDDMVSSSYLLKHDFLQCFENGDFGNMTDATAIFAENHYIYAHHFIDYLLTVVNKIGNRTIAEPVLENIEEESGHYSSEDLSAMADVGIESEWFDKIPHKYLYNRFLTSLNIDSQSIDEQEYKNRAGNTFATAMYEAYENSNACEGLSVIGFAIEETVSTLYQYLWNGMKNHTQISDRDLVFFPLHIIIDDGHADLLKLAYQSILNSYPETCSKTKDIVNDALHNRIRMFDELREEIESRQGYNCKLPKNPNKKQQECSQGICSEFKTDDIVKQAMAETKGMQSSSVTENWTLQQKMAMSARILADQGHGGTLSGQITCVEKRNNEILMWATPYGKPLKVLTENDFILIDENLNVRETSSKVQSNNIPLVNKATRFHLHVYRKRPDIKCIVHTHPPKTSALAMTGKPLHIGHMDTMAFYEDVQYLPAWPGIPFGDDEGRIISHLLSDKYWSALMAHHGLIVAGESIEQATYRAYFFERAAGMQIDALAANGGNMNSLPKVNAALARKARDWRVSSGPVNAHFNGWAQIAIAKQKDC